MKNINRERVLISFMILITVALVCAVVLFGAEHDNGPVIKILTFVYDIIAFPNYIMWELHVFENWPDVAAGIVAGTLIYSFLIEVILIKLCNRSGIEHPTSEI